ncbi:[protein-PII] uridylyltransferase family protein [Meridianimarinicoccus sp. RP-17]|nr:glutamine-synthetase adenylyltransferase [Phycocomes zhengii]
MTLPQRAAHPAPMDFAARITRTPLPHDPDRAAEALRGLGWAGNGPLRDLLAGTAGCSPYLAGLMAREGDWLEGAFAGDPCTALDAVLGDLAPGPAADIAPALRRAKARVALLAGLADLGGVWGLDDVTRALTRLADTATDVALKSALLADLTRGKLPGQTLDDLDTAAGLVALAMGKMGAFELNYSSDIDLILLFDDARFDGADLAEARSVFLKAARRAMALLSDNTGDGYVFRTDLRLRPDPSATPIVVSFAAAERYYEALGRTWERQAFIKARPAAGDIDAGKRFLRDIRPFIWRRHLDFTTVQDVHDIRQKIRAQKGLGGAGLDGTNLKLAPGGIREIEFFTQTRQLIAGGRDPKLRLRGTRAALARLADHGWVGQAEAEGLDADYARLRELEHRVQMVQDAQTHDLPTRSDDWQRLADFTGGGDVAALRAEITDLMARVFERTEDFFAPEPTAPPPPLSDTAERLVEQWQHYPALRSKRARGIFERLLPRLIEGFERAAHPDEAMVQFDGFLKGLPAGVQVFSLFDANPTLIDLMVDISSTAPALARYLAANSGVLDAVIGGSFFEGWPGLDALTADLAERLANPDLDYERQLDTARYWQKDWHFRVGVHHLRGLIGPDEAAAEYSDLAQACVAGIWDATCAEFARRHGPLPGRGAVVLGMGSLGARTLSAGSDLDLIVVYDADPDAESDGRKPLAARAYYARLTKALVTALSAKTAAGALYEVDMRLRPSGRQGPAAASWVSFRNYQQTEAWTWEHLALTRARVIAGDAGLGTDLEDFRRTMLAEQPRGLPQLCADLSDMRTRLASAKPQAGPWDVTNGPGGLQDIELFGQLLALVGGSPLRQVPDQLALPGPLANGADCRRLSAARDLFARIKAVARLLTDQPLDPERLGHGGRQMLLRDTSAADLDALQAAVAAARNEAAAAIACGLETGLDADGLSGNPEPSKESRHGHAG